ncbi:DUF4145 domain-containing protein [Rhizobium leguminosarum]|uniref:DUF4145 domain-containing protein n=1 Tax=Rhizobium leguminosarum TaxID=384 RepID=UPI0010309DED|nr:DUF4145 domain-containing protein [Rhizobium leguminosarum]TAV48424.1 DUF4145 domain-containing protein [Rhizobium leguminosarum]TAV57924.1 DUF4145 domain-containing protein [Rhizobium leguminosarum]TAV68865.1 DUF4145 domain-containing protein [Rhizobium leguminosarum]
MAKLTYTCPHCGADYMTVDVHARYIPAREFIVSKKTRPYGVIHVICARCWQPSGFKVYSPALTTPDQHSRFIDVFSEAMQREYDLLAGGLRTEIIPTPTKEAQIPDHLPASVEKAFKAAERNYALPDCEDAAAMLYRRSLDIAIREKHPEIQGLLAPRIAQLAKLGLLPPAMKEWADQIRLIGNDGAHDPEGVSHDDLKPMRGFTEAFLRYFITLPFEVSLRRGEIDADGKPIQA